MPEAMCDMHRGEVTVINENVPPEQNQSYPGLPSLYRKHIVEADIVTRDEHALKQFGLEKLLSIGSTESWGTKAPLGVQKIRSVKRMITHQMTLGGGEMQKVLSSFQQRMESAREVVEDKLHHWHIMEPGRRSGRHDQSNRSLHNNNHSIRSLDASNRVSKTHSTSAATSHALPMSNVSSSVRKSRSSGNTENSQGKASDTKHSSSGLSLETPPVDKSRSANSLTVHAAVTNPAVSHQASSRSDHDRKQMGQSSTSSHFSTAVTNLNSNGLASLRGVISCDDFEPQPSIDILEPQRSA